ncbi:LCP family protein [Occultella aeris]|uniref:LCP family protein n=1 Tax=Occultella aeris TaxID=2761496 RepID=UPI001E5602C2|nr:LCP family protein [Occultella aeris]
MSRDEPFDNEREPEPASVDPFADAPRRTAPGRKPVRGSSRARTGGSAQAVPATGGPERTGGRSTATSGPSSRAPERTVRRTPSGAARPAAGRPAAKAPAAEAGAPPSFAPGSGERTDRTRGTGPRPAANATRVMPAQDEQGMPPARRPQRPVGDQPRRPPASTRPPDGPTAPPAPKARKPRRRGRRVVALLAVLLILVLAWPVGLLVWANGKIQHTDALGSSTLSTAGTTYLLAGSDSRADGQVADATEGQRADTMILITVPPSGATSMISLPRDTYVEIPGYGANKLNAAFSFGGPELLVATVEGLTGIEVDHYVEIGMGGVANIVDAVGGVELCLDYDVSDADSGLEWTAGCHVVDGATALAFARMRKADPLGDIGRTQRQQQVIQAVTSAVAQPSLVFQPGEQVRLAEEGLAALVVDEDTGIIDMARMALAFRAATGPDGVRGAPPISDLAYRPGGIGEAVLLHPDRVDAFFTAVADGTVTTADLNQ